MMQALVKSNQVGQVEWIGQVHDHDRTLSQPEEAIELDFEGLPQDVHRGRTRAACARVTDVYPKDVEIHNTRQLSILSQEEIALISRDMGIDGLDPAWIGASLIVSGIPDFTYLPPASRLQFDGGLTLVVDVENLPCHIPAKEINRHTDDKGRAFKQAAKTRRGVTAWVERPGRLSLNSNVTLFVPQQRSWQGA
ncbi:MAG: MOSC domain-containing protein [Halocynthiibacter sp.]